jgi:hypothetical protein
MIRDFFPFSLIAVDPTPPPKTVLTRPLGRCPKQLFLHRQ